MCISVLVSVTEDIVGREVKAINGPVLAVSGNFAVEGGIVKRRWRERGHWYYKLMDPTTKSEFPSCFPASGFDVVEDNNK